MSAICYQSKTFLALLQTTSPDVATNALLGKPFLRSITRKFCGAHYFHINSPFLDFTNIKVFNRYTHITYDETWKEASSSKEVNFLTIDLILLTMSIGKE